MNQNQLSSDFSPAIRRARLDNLTIYEVSESELEIIERGSPDSIYLTISVALLTLATSFLGSLLLTEIKSSVILFLFIAIVVVGFIVGGILLILWKRSSSSVAICVAAIRRRLPPEGELVKNNGAEG
jgi:predicted neutral ceramidase superfamily lipid hydrolase